jgi:peroxiredoxin
VLIQFYTMDWEPSCAAGLMARRDEHAKLEAEGVQVVGISLNIAYSQAAYAKSLRLPYPLLSDFPHGRTVRSFGVGYEEGEAARLLARPAAFLIDQAGIVRKKEVGPTCAY